MTTGILPMIAAARAPARQLMMRARNWAPFIVVVGTAAALLLLEPGDYVTTFATVFLGVFFEALPFLLAGVLLSATLQTWVPAAWFPRFLPNGRLRGALAGAAIGALLPVCECGVVPVARRLLVRGASLPAVLGFMLAGPVVNPVVFAATWTAFGPVLAVARLGLSLTVAVSVAWLYGWHPQPASVMRTPRVGADDGADEQSPASGPGARRPAARTPAGVLARLAATTEIASDELLDMGRLLVLGAAAAAALRTLVPGSVLIAAGQEPVLSVGLMMLLAALLSICSVVDAFVALSFSALVPTGALLAFLVFGPIVDIKSVLLYGGVFRWRTVALLVLLITQVVLLLGIAITLHSG